MSEQVNQTALTTESTAAVKPELSAKPKPAPEQKGKSGRIAVSTLVVLITIGALAVGIPWIAYRFNHVVVSEATVKGTVTKVGARIEGRIKSIDVERGQNVYKGQVLIRMEDRHLQAALERARAELESATKDLTSEKMGIEQSRKRLTIEIERCNGTRKKAAGELAAHKSVLSNAQSQFQRVFSLAKQGAASLSEVDRAMSDRDRAQALVNASLGSVDAAESSYQKAMNELEGIAVRESHLAVLDSQIAMARARVSQAEADVEATVIKAPEDGRVLDRLVEVGGSAKVGEPMLALWIGRAWVEAWVDERDLRKFKIGTQVDVSLDSDPNRKLSGRVIGFGLESDKQMQLAPVPATLHSLVRQNALVPVRIALDEDNSKIQLGLSVMVGIKKEAALGAEIEPVVRRVPGANPPSALTRVNAKD
jgi:multidrug resistance efflux pump